jgi:hypothetical protein
MMCLLLSYCVCEGVRGWVGCVYCGVYLRSHYPTSYYPTHIFTPLSHHPFYPTSLIPPTPQTVLNWHGRYRLIQRRPEHHSDTCYVYKAIDVQTQVSREREMEVVVVVWWWCGCCFEVPSLYVTLPFIHTRRLIT